MDRLKALFKGKGKFEGKGNRLGTAEVRAMHQGRPRLRCPPGQTRPATAAMHVPPQENGVDAGKKGMSAGAKAAAARAAAAPQQAPSSGGGGGLTPTRVVNSAGAAWCVRARPEAAAAAGVDHGRHAGVNAPRISLL
jgi:hypothetical protein